MPRSCPATSNEQRVRVEVFSNSSTMFLPSRYRCGVPVSLRFLNWRESLSKYLISGVVKSSSLRKSRPERLVGM